MRQAYNTSVDPETAKRIRTSLSHSQEPERVKLPKPTPAENLKRWKLAAAASQSPADIKAKRDARDAQGRPKRLARTLTEMREGWAEPEEDR